MSDKDKSRGKESYRKLLDLDASDLSLRMNLSTKRSSVRGYLPIAYRVKEGITIAPGTIVDRKTLEASFDDCELKPGITTFTAVPWVTFRPYGLSTIGTDLTDLYLREIRVAHCIQAIMGEGHLPLVAFQRWTKKENPLDDADYRTCEPGAYLLLQLLNKSNSTRKIQCWFTGIWIAG